MTFTELSQFPRSSRPRRRLDLRLESPGQLAVVAIVLWLVGAVLHPLALLAPLGLVLLLVAGTAYLLRPRSHTMYWRGRQIDLDDGPRVMAQIKGDPERVAIGDIVRLVIEPLFDAQDGRHVWGYRFEVTGQR